ncbi:S-methyl-5'-thioadenosine phosphorylase [Hyphococcus formosus]|uniref:S-methyl-5'-thioadenosine phosphorylase n=1 Tax=Hyphococcus formosus TaxID=3143534 RepID=UPI00398A66F9
MADQKRILGFIGGSGVYSVDALENPKKIVVTTPWGEPSDALVRGKLSGVEVVFLARHGNGHRIPPNEVNYRANIDAMKRLGVTDIISISSCGSFREELAPGSFVVVDQFVDRTTMREKSFFGSGFVAHVSMADPVCPALATALAESCAALNIPHATKGTYLAIDGPQFSSRAESHMYRAWGCDVIGMTNMPEAKLAREAEIPYATLAMVTDYDCWRENTGAVEVGHILETMQQNTKNAARLVSDLILRLGAMRKPSPLGIETALDMAVITPPNARDQSTIRKLNVIAGRFLNR